MHSVIPSSAKRTSLNVLYDNNYSNNDTTRDYYVRFNKTHFVKSRFFGESSFTTGSASFKEPHFFPGVSRTDLTGGRVCSSFSFIFSKNVIANSTALSNNTLSLLYRLDQGRFANYSSLLKRRTKKYNYRSARVRPRYKRLQRKRPTPTYLSRYKRRRKHGITSMYKFAELSLGNNLRYI